MSDTYTVEYRDALVPERVLIETDDRQEAIFWVFLATKDSDMTLISASPELTAA